MKTSTKLIMSLKLAAIMIITAVSCVFAQQQKDYSKEPGYVNFGDLSAFETGDKVTEVTLDEQLLQVAAGFSKNDKKASALMSGLKLIKVNSFEVSKKNREQVLNKISAIDNELMGKKWNRIVKSRSSDESSNVYIRTGNDGQVVGLVVTSLGKNGEASFINIVGNIDMDAMSSLSEEFDIPSLNHMKGHKK